MSYAERIAAAYAAQDMVALLTVAIEMAGVCDQKETSTRSDARSSYRSGYVYYAREGQEVKIGYSRNPWSRVNELRTGRPGLALVAVEAGSRELEQQRHQQFAYARTHAGREWFRLTPDLTAHLAAVGGDVAFVAATGATPPSPSLSSPRPLLNPSSPPEPLAQSNGVELTPDIDTAETLALSLSNLLGDRLGDVRRFVATRRRETWPAWMRQMLKLIGPGSQFTAADLADACNDAMALEEPIAGPHALRAFIAKQRHERMVPPGTTTRVGRAITAQDADEKAAEQRRRNGLVSARRARGDGDLWWERMQRDSGNPHPWSYAYDHMHETGDGRAA